MKTFSFLILLLISVFLLVPTAEGIESRNGQDSRVLIVSIPRISWQDLQDVDTENIDQVITQGAVANLSVRVPGPGRSLEKGYATLSAGNRADAVSATQSTFYHPNENTNFGTAKEIFEKEQGVEPNNVQGLLLGAEMTFERNTGLQAPASVGAFADSLQSNNKSMAVFGNSDYCLPHVFDCNQRSIGFIGSNQNGVIKNGVISRDLLNSDLTQNMENTAELANESIENNAVTSLECSNLEKLERWKRDIKPDLVDSRFESYLKECDELIGKMIKELDFQKDQIYIVSPMSSVDIEQLTVFISAGYGIEKGYATSGITRADAIVALADIAPSILRIFDIEPPKSMVETELAYESSNDSIENRIQNLIDMDKEAQIRDATFNSVSAVFIFMVFVTLAVGLLAISKYTQLRSIAMLMSFITLAMTIVPFLMTPFMLQLSEPTLVLAAFVSVSVIIGLLGYFTGKKYSHLKLLLFFALFNVIVLLADIFTGGNLQFNSLFGNSSIVAGRFAGFGNMAFSILSISCIVIVACIKQLNSESSKEKSKKINLLLIAFLVLVLLAIGLPAYGSDIGGVLAFTPTVFIVSLMLFERKINLKTTFIAFIVTLLAISVFSVFDLNRPVSERSHLGRFVQVVADGEAWVVIERKLASNLATFSNSIFLTFILIGSIYSLFLFTKPEEFIKQKAKEVVGIRFLVYPGSLLAVLAMLLNDSGVAIGGMMAAVAVPAFLIFNFGLDRQSKPRHDKAHKNV